MNRTSRHAPLAALLVMLLAACQSAPVATPQAVEPASPAEAPAQAPPQPEATQPPQPEPAPPPVEVSEPEQPPQAKVVCVPPPVVKHAPAAPERPASVLPILGVYEQVSIEPPGLQFKARLDTGVSGSQIDARDARDFERDGKPWVKFHLTNRETGEQSEVSRPLIRTVPGRNGSRRYVVSLRTRLGGIDQFTEFLLSDRSGSSTPVVLGRDFLRDQALVDVAKRYTVSPARH